MVAELGADALGMVLADSPRRVTATVAKAIVERVPNLIWKVGVFMDQPAEEIAAITDAVPFDVLQFHGAESPEFCYQRIGAQRYRPRLIKRFAPRTDETVDTLTRRMQQYDAAVYLLDPGAGAGRTFDWSLAAGIPLPLMIAGGLTPENVGEVVRQLRPAWVDVASGVEWQVGRKDPSRVRAFIEAVRNEDKRYNS